jgi:hypothetical protein
MRKIYSLLTLFFAMLTVTGCEKFEDNDGMVEIFAESMTGSSKVLLDGPNATWMDGDAIRLNNYTHAVQRIQGHAYISNTGLNNNTTNYALYPASLEVTNWGTNTPTITFPAYYHYRTNSSGQQILELPMAAYSTDNNPLQFKHLTGALYITVTNTYTHPVTLHSVTVASRNHQLCGKRQINMDHLENISGVPPTSDNDKSVCMLFDTGYTLAQNESVRVMIPVLPVDSANMFNVIVKSHTENQPKMNQFSKWQPSDRNNSLARNELGYAPASLSSSDGTTEIDILSNNGTAYEIRTPFDFYLMTKSIDGAWLSRATYKMVADVDMTGLPVSPITNSGVSAVCTINGAGHTVSNLTINGTKIDDEVFCALFKSSGATIQNITFDNLRLVNEGVGSSTLYVGAIEAYNSTLNSSGTKTISNCTVNIGSFSDGGATGEVYFGGLIGYLQYAKLSMTNCNVTMPAINIGNATVVWWGGFVGSMGSSNANITTSTWRGNGTIELHASNRMAAGGFFGFKNGGAVNATGSVSGTISAYSNGTNRYIGSIVGQTNGISGERTVTTTEFSAMMNGTPYSVGEVGVNY